MVSPAKLEEKGPLRRLNRAINSVNALAQSMRIQRGLGYSVRHTAHGQVLQLEDQKSTTVTTKQTSVAAFRVKQNKAKYILGVRINSLGEEIDTALIAIAKPSNLWVINDEDVYGLFADNTVVKSAFHRTIPSENDYDWRKLYFGTISTSSKYILQKVTPSYIAQGGLAFRNYVYAANVNGIATDESNSSIDWVDLNVDARHWEVPLMQSSMCVESYDSVRGVFTTTASEAILPADFKK